jgi:hypothetical protein
MYTVKQTFHPPFTPVAEAGAVVRAPGVRFTVLTPRLIRMEYSPERAFRRPAQPGFWYRSQPVPDFRIYRDEACVEIDTGELRLTYDLRAEGFQPAVPGSHDQIFRPGLLLRRPR